MKQLHIAGCLLALLWLAEVHAAGIAVPARGNVDSVGREGQHATSGLNDGSSSKKQGASSSNKPELPAPVKVAPVDSYKFDQCADKLDLTAEQTAKVKALKEDLNKNIADLERRQNDARTEYTKASNTKETNEALPKVVATAEACRAYNATLNFERGVESILTFDQRKKFKELTTKAA